MIKKRTVFIGVSLVVLALIAGTYWHLKYNDKPGILRQVPIWELNDMSEAEYKAQETEKSDSPIESTLLLKAPPEEIRVTENFNPNEYNEETIERFNSFTGLPQFAQISTENVIYHNTNQATAVEGYLAMPEGNGPFPAIVMIHEWWGLNDQIKDMARQYAGQGYAVLAVDLYNGDSATTPEEARVLATRVRGLPEPAFANLKDAMAYLQNLENVDPKRLASLGWCFGGGWSYEVAKNNLGAKASVIYYGRFNPEDDLDIMSTKIQGHFGADDKSIPVDDVKAFQAKLQTLEGEHQVFIYENAGHAFANEESDAYQQESAEQAWERTLEFLKTNL